jgi:hypothetical protein
MKYWSIGSRSDTLQLTIYAPSKESAIKLAETLTGPQNPNQRVVHELPRLPANCVPPLGTQPQFLDEVETEDE